MTMPVAVSASGEKGLYLIIMSAFIAAKKCGFGLKIAYIGAVL